MFLASVNFTILDWNENVLDWIVRILVASICGFAIGFERKSRSKEAGIRTHAIVCVAAAIMMIVSKYGFSDALEEKVITSSDGGRLAAQVISGIGFLGAGIIFVRRDVLHGLTTAAGVWATAGIGLAIGAGMYIIGIASVLIVLFIQILMHKPLKLFRENTHMVLRISVYLEDKDTVNKVRMLFESKKFLSFKTTNTDKGCLADIDLATTEQFTAEQLYTIMSENPFIKSIEKNEEM